MKEIVEIIVNINKTSGLCPANELRLHCSTQVQSDILHTYCFTSRTGHMEEKVTGTQFYSFDFT